MFRKKRAVKFRYTITFVSASGLNDGSFVHVAWKRGSKSANHGETSQQEVSGGSVDWNETVTVLCTLFSSSSSASGYEEKDLVLTLTEFSVEKKKDVVLGKLVVNLSDFALAGSEAETKYHNVKPLKKGGASGASGPFVLVMSYMAEVLSEGDADAVSETDAGDAEVSVADDFDADDTSAIEDPFAPSAMAAAAASSSASPKPASPGHGSGSKKKGARKNKRTASSSSIGAGAAASPGLVVTSPPGGGGGGDSTNDGSRSSSGIGSTLGSVGAAAATVAVPAVTVAGDERLADVVRERDELRQTVEQLRKKAARTSGTSADGVDAGALQQELAQLRDHSAAVEQELAETREALAAKTAAETRLVAESRDARAQVAHQQAAVRAGPGAATGDGAALVAALEARVAAVEGERAALKGELAAQAERNRAEQRALRTRVTELEAALGTAAAAAAATASSAAASASTSGGKARGKSDRERERGEADALQRQNAQLARRWDVLAELVESVAAARVTPAGKPLAALLVADYLRKGGPLDDPASFRPVVDALRLALACPMPDCATPLFWTATLLCVLQDLGRSVAAVPAPATLAPGDPATATTVADALLRLLVTAYSRALDNAYRRLEPAAIECFITATASPTADSSSSNAQSSSSSSPTPSTASQEVQSSSSHAVIAVLAEVAEAARRVRLPPSVRRQLVAQLVYDIDATVFNALVRDETLCTCARVFRIRMAMSVLERWLLRDPELAPAKRQLRYTREAANLFAMDKSVLADDGAIAAAFAALNIAQLARLLQYYHPDDLNRLSVDAALLRDIKLKALEADNAPLEVDGHAWCPSFSSSK